jgi:RimJ/RimL family protein N-acetyltransferase
MTSSIRHAAADDWDAFRAVFDSVAAEGRWIGWEPPVDWDLVGAQFQERLSRRWCLTLLVEVDDEVVGWAFAEHQRNGRAELGMGLVDGHRGVGHGSRLLAEVIDWGRRRRAGKLSLEVWPHNAPAIALYEKFGFTVEGRHPRHWRRRDGSLWDVISMGLVLDDDAPGGPTY